MSTVGLCHPLAVIVGENNAGKSNVIDALRTVLEPDAGPRGRCWLGEEDFAHDADGIRIADALELEVQLGGLSKAEQARMVTCLAPQAGNDVAKLRLRAQVGADGRIITQWLGGDSQHPDVERHAREAVRFVYLHPLRDAAADLRPGRDNRLVGLLRSLAPKDEPDHQQIIDAAKTANDALDKIGAVVAARKHVAKRLAGMTGSGRFAQNSNLEFDDPVFDRVVASLRAKIGQFAALDMAENGLGYNNLLYMAVLLAAMTDAPNDEEPTLRVLLVEEPEAHLHPQLQDLLMRFLESEAVGATQVIVTTHSPTFASSAHVERLTVLARASDHELPVARLPRDFGLDPVQLAYLRRFLDVTKASLFFARAVILVEGVAEQLLIPVIAERLGRPLARSGVAVINVGGVAFPPFTDLFAEDRLPYHMAVVSDADGQPDENDLEGAPESLSPRAAGLAARAGDNVRVVLARRTLEWDLAAAGNIGVMIEALTQVKPQVGAALAAAAGERSKEENASVLLDKVEDVKGRFAQELAERLADPGTPLQTPDYLREAIEWVADKEADGEPDGADESEGADADGGS